MSAPTAWNDLMSRPSMRLLARCGFIDGAELNMMENFARIRRAVDESDREWLSRVFVWLDPATFDPVAWDDLQALKAELGIR